jgi:predicted nucleic-acid-binding protein
MISVDTNVIVRLAANDDDEQVKRAKRMFERAPIFIAVTVLLETEWVLRSAYNVSRDRIAHFLGGIAGLENVHIEARARFERALGAYREGLDFADALHLAAADGSDGFATFDETLRARAPGGFVTVMAP